jgi:hypothetical protein
MPGFDPAGYLVLLPGSRDSLVVNPQRDTAGSFTTSITVIGISYLTSESPLIF